MARCARRLLQLEEAARHRLAAPRLSGTARLGVVEEVAGGSLPSALGRFAMLHLGGKLEVQIGVSAELIEDLDAGRLDVVFAKRPLGTSRGRLVWREPLVWAAADRFDLVLNSALPLALHRERSVSRAAALAGLAITPLPTSAVIAGLRIVGLKEGLPRLPELEFAIYEKARNEKAAAALAAALLALGQSPARPTI
jgi:DNA-binding transcriptional LysR family regulator